MHNFDKSYDDKLNNISTLKWIPYIGKNYNKLIKGKRLLIIGESHYLPNITEDWYKDVETKNFTRANFVSYQIKKPNNDMEKILRNIQEVFLNDDPYDTLKSKFWESVSYYNFIQRALESSNNRPTYDDFKIGWETFFKVVDLLKPDYCLFCGVAAINETGSMIEKANNNLFNQNWDINSRLKDISINGVNPRRFKLNKENNETLVLCTVHPCYRGGFTSSLWRDFIDQNMKEYTTWLREV